MNVKYFYNCSLKNMVINCICLIIYLNQVFSLAYLFLFRISTCERLVLYFTSMCKIQPSMYFIRNIKHYKCLRVMLHAAT